MGKDVELSKRGPMSKIEIAGEKVINHLLELCKTTDMSYQEMANRVNEIYGTNLNKVNVFEFFKKNQDLTNRYIEEKRSLSTLRAKMNLDYHEELVKDIRELNKGIENLTGDEGMLLEPDKKWKQISDLIDKKGRLLLREARISGKMNKDRDGSTNIDNMQVNVFNQKSDEENEFLKKLKKFEEPKKEKDEDKDVIDIDADED